MNGALSGIRVLDLSQVVAGPLATQLMAEQGADVIKRCVAVDLNHPAAAEVILELASTCDVYIQNFRPGVVDRLGVGIEEIRRAAPDIVSCSISGLGTTGPYADRAVLDPVVQALIGMIDGQVSDAFPFPDFIRTLVADKSTALTAAQAITAALFARERGGGGQHLEISMLDAALAWFWPDGMSDLTHDDPSIASLRGPDMYQLIETRDGMVVYYLGTNAQIAGMWRVLGREDLLAEPTMCTMIGLRDTGNRAVASDAIRAGLAAMTADDAVDAMVAQSIPCGPVLARADVLTDPQVVHNDILVEWDHPVAGPLRQPRPAVRFSATPAGFRPHLDSVGAHTDEVLAEAGFTAAAIGSLRQGGAVA